MSATEETRNSVEFIAFLLWYSFLVFCCVLPTCCAYRRRQMLMQLQREEAEFEQRYFFGGSPFVVGNDANGGMDEEEARAERTRRITAALKATSFVVAEKDIVKNKEYVGEHDVATIAANIETKIQVDEELGAVVDRDMMDQNLVQLPLEGENAGRLVPGGCAICLDTLGMGDEVIWSPMASCPHAFHQDCIIPWLAKKEEPKCPCCRQIFCEVEPVRSEPSRDPFGLMSSGFIMRQNFSQNGRELIIIPSGNLIVSQTIDDRGMLGFRISEREPPALAYIRNTELDEEAVEENTSTVENVNETSSNAASDEGITRMSSEIEMEEIGDRGAAADGETPSSEQSAMQGDPNSGGNEGSVEGEVLPKDSAAK